MDIRNTNKVATPRIPWENNFELTVQVGEGSQLTKSNYSTCLGNLENRLEYSQQSDVSQIHGFNISKVVRDEEGAILSSSLVISDNKGLNNDY